jgi:choline-glycine betaine transporter
VDNILLTKLILLSLPFALISIFITINVIRLNKRLKKADSLEKTKKRTQSAINKKKDTNLYDLKTRKKN